MALNVTFFNKFTDTEVDIGESANDSNPIRLNPDGNHGPIFLNTNQSRFIWAAKNCEIRISASADAPKVQIQLSGSKWEFTNKGTNTSAQVDVGPDGQ